ncbi:hypothetical protein PoB_001996600 [Plakobranchus ocellatus]|uniref:Uncharacterized protein n=1 Tax=Plakobranchus ocellatus TaxID=259542 RepID=A0AAV3ZFP9_9GAST|nr:hypothetical protein PoB_001996600 [Plakobranchus ocellatus]
MKSVLPGDNDTFIRADIPICLGTFSSIISSVPSNGDRIVETLASSPNKLDTLVRNSRVVVGNEMKPFWSRGVGLITRVEVW